MGAAMIAGHFILGSTFRSQTTDITFSVTQKRRSGRWHFHILVWERPSDGGPSKPTDLDLDLPVWRLPDFFAALRRAQTKMSELGLLDVSPPRSLALLGIAPEGTA